MNIIKWNCCIELVRYVEVKVVFFIVIEEVIMIIINYFFNLLLVKENVGIV